MLNSVRISIEMVQLSFMSGTFLLVPRKYVKQFTSPICVFSCIRGVRYLDATSVVIHPRNHPLCNHRQLASIRPALWRTK